MNPRKIVWEISESEKLGFKVASISFFLKEVVLKKTAGKFGVLLCYGGGDSDVAVYVGDVSIFQSFHHIYQNPFILITGRRSKTLVS